MEVASHPGEDIGLLRRLCGVVRCDGAMAALLPVAEQTREMVMLGVTAHPIPFAACMAAAAVGGVGTIVRHHGDVRLPGIRAA